MFLRNQKIMKEGGTNFEYGWWSLSKMLVTWILKQLWHRKRQMKLVIYHFMYSCVQNKSSFVKLSISISSYLLFHISIHQACFVIQLSSTRPHMSTFCNLSNLLGKEGTSYSILKYNITYHIDIINNCKTNYCGALCPLLFILIGLDRH